MRVVLDPNVLVSGLIGRATSSPQHVDAIVSGDKDVLEAALDDLPAWTPREMADRLQGTQQG